MTKFRVYIRYTTLYYLVSVWNTKEELLKYRRNQEISSPNADCEAYVDPYHVYRVSRKRRGKPQTSRKLPILGEIHFHKDRLGTEIISHETIHAVVGYLKRLNKKFASMDELDADIYMGYEEELAYLVGRFNSDLVSKLYKYKLYEEM